jgi:hypothetical protein
MWTSLTFGENEGQSLPQTLFTDPDWFFWSFDNGVLAKHGMMSEASILNWKASNILVPDDGSGSPRLVEYYDHPPTRKFSHFLFVPETKPPHLGTSNAWRSSTLDMRVPYRMAPYDKKGMKSLVASIKHHFFAEARLTRNRCEEFFDDDANFAPPSVPPGIIDAYEPFE